ncbi:MAG: F0F1 ATP synthase subunit gamma [Myxococcales bacterium]|nr:F0F1 ATP synthase subunit gamma [Myxococcales bacterium]
MSTLEEIKKKLNNTQALHTIVKTMKSLAAVSIRQYERAVSSLQDYHRTLELSFRIVLRQHGIEALTHRDKPIHLIAVVFGSDQGLCGTLNEVIANHVESTVLTQDASPLQRLAAQQPKQDLSQDPDGVEAIEKIVNYGPYQSRTLFGVGERAAVQLEDRGWNLQQVFPVPVSIAGVTPVMQELLFALEEKRQSLEPVQILLFHNRPVDTASFTPVCTPLWPVDQAWLGTLEKKPWPTRQLPGFDLPWRTLFASLLQQHLFVSLYRSCVESLASEFASRLASMQSAEKNIERLLDDLGLSFQQQRQDAITSELLDIVAGAEALR